MQRPLNAGVAGLVLAAMPALSPAATVTTQVQGNLAASVNACRAVDAIANLDDCSYNGSDPHNGGTTGSLEWIGPTFAGAYYAPGTAPGADATPLPGDNKTSLGITGSITIIDNNDGFGANDLVSFSLTVGAGTLNIDSGPLTRHQLSWNTLTYDLAFTQTSSASPNGGGGFDYVFGSAGAPPALTGVFDDFPSETASTHSPALTGSYWTAPATAGIAAFEGNVGAAPSVSEDGWSCTPGSDGSDCSGRTVATEQAWNNLILLISTDAGGNVVTASGYTVRETDEVPDASFLTDTWESGHFSLTAVPLPAAAWLYAGALALLGWLRRRT